MPTIGAPLRKWTMILLLCRSQTLAQPTNDTSLVDTPTVTSVAASPASSAIVSVTPSPPQSTFASEPNATCPFRTINYITHTLPQQCLKTSWSATAPALPEEPEQEAEATPSPGIEIPWAVKEGGKDDTSLQPGAQETGSSGAGTDSASTSTQAEAEAETDSPLDNANFLSFEEWKKKNLERSGQNPENVGQGRASSSETRPRRRPVNVNALDSLGEESEIDLDFGGFGSAPEGGQEASGPVSITQGPTDAAKTVGEEGNAAPSSWALSKDAGKTCKERFNYASFDCAATVLKTNSKAKSSSAVLVENKDSYMLNECSAQNKFIIVELCDDILVDTVVLANYEFFSSMFRHFRVSVSDRYPVKMDRWRTLGTFEARNSRDIQPFLVSEPQIWARYLRIEFMTHFGNEFYCPISLLRVHGTTMMEQFRREEEEARGVDDFTEPIDEVDGEPVNTAIPTVDEGGAVPTGKLPSEPDKDVDPKAVRSTVADDTSKTAADADARNQSTSTQSQPVGAKDAHETSTIVAHSADPTAASKRSPPSHDSSTLSHTPSSNTPHASGKFSETETAQPPNEKRTGQSASHSTEATSLSHGSSSELPTVGAPGSASTNGKVAPKAISDEATNTSSGTPVSRSISNSTAGVGQSQSQTRSPSQSQPNAATPSTQESFFKSISKRLQQLEANSTLSLQYIEEQSRILRDAFVKVEKRQLSKTEKFLDHLNNTVVQELKSYRSMYDQLWQSTILELEGMKERQKTEIGEIGARLSLVADELVWQKRMAVVQSTLLLLCLGLVLFVRSGPLGSQMDVPIVQQLGNKASRFFDTPPGSPEAAGIIRRRRTFKNMWRSDTSALSERSGHLSDGINATSDAETDGHRSPVQVEFSPPACATSRLSPEPLSSPPQRNGASRDTARLTPTEEAEPDMSDQGKRIQVLATQSGPATPNGTRDSRPSWEEVDRAVDLLKAEEQDQASQQQQHERDSKRQRRKKRSPLRRAESYDGQVDVNDSPGDDAEGLFVA